MKKFLPLIILAALMAATYFSGLTQYLSLEGIKAQQENFNAFYAEHRILTPLLFALAYIIVTALSLPIASLFTFLGGALFGLYFGTALVVSSATIGASILFLIARSSLGTTLRDKASGFYDKFEAEMNENGFNYLLFLRLVPVFPFFIVNIVPALFNMRLSSYVIATFLGILPGTAIYVNIGRSLAEIDSLSGLLTTKTLSAFVLLGLFALVPTAIKKFKK